LPSAPVKCATLVSIEITKSMCMIGVGEVVEPVRMIFDQREFAQRLLIAIADVLLQRVPFRPF
jgi:hypothetical protein